MSDVACPFCGARGTEHCTTKGGKNHPSRDMAIAYDELCKAEETVGSYPGEATMFCGLSNGHAGMRGADLFVRAAPRRRA